MEWKIASQKQYNFVFLKFFFEKKAAWELKQRIVQLQTGTVASAQIVQGAVAAALEIGVKGNANATGVWRHVLRIRVETQGSFEDAVQRLAWFDALTELII